MSKIKVGMINDDLHGLYYAVLMAPHDPILLGDTKGCRGHSARFYFYTSYSDPTKLMVPPVEGFEFTKIWNSERSVAEAVSAIWDDHPEVCDSFEEVSDGVDLVFIPDCNGDGSEHLKWATPGLKKGVATFVDKPFAYDVKDVVKMVEMAHQHDTPVMSLSMMRESPHIGYFRDRLQELGQPEFATIRSSSGSMAGHIHAISFAQHLFGSGVESVDCMGEGELDYLHLNYPDGSTQPVAGVMLNCHSGAGPHCAVFASAFSKHGAIHSPPIGDFEFPYGARAILEKIKEMVHSGKPQAPYEEMIECIAIATAGRIAQKEGRRVLLSEVL